MDKPRWKLAEQGLFTSKFSYQTIGWDTDATDHKKWSAIGTLNEKKDLPYFFGNYVGKC